MPSPAPGTAPPEGQPSIKEVADRQDRLEGKLDQLIGLVKGGEHQAQGAAARHEAAKLDAPTDVAEEVRRQIAERDQAQQAAAAADQAKTTEQSWRQDIDTKLAELTERTPEAPARRVEKFLGWRP